MIHKKIQCVMLNFIEYLGQHSKYLEAFPLDPFLNSMQFFSKQLSIIERKVLIGISRSTCIIMMTRQ